MSIKTALISGVLGQDGSHLADYLISLDYQVIGIARRHSTEAESYGFLDHLKDHKRFELIHGDVKDSVFLSNVLSKYKPNEIYHLAAMSNVWQSFQEPLETFQVDAVATMNLLLLAKDIMPECKFYMAATSELYGGINCPSDGYTEESPFHPKSPYGVAKLASYWFTINMREAYKIFACCGILFNHGGKRRGLDFVERKITNGVAKIKLGLADHILLGNLDSYRDLGSSSDYVKAMVLMLQQDHPSEYVIATGETHQIREILDLAFKSLGINNYEQYVKYDPALMRPSEVPYLLGNPSKAKRELDWSPTYTFESLIEEMIREDYNTLKKFT